MRKKCQNIYLIVIFKYKFLYVSFTETMNFYVRDNNSMFKYLFLCYEQFL